MIKNSRLDEKRKVLRLKIDSLGQPIRQLEQMYSSNDIRTDKSQSHAEEKLKECK